VSINSFADKGTEDIFHGVDSKPARKTLNKSVWAVACRKLDMLEAAVSLQDLNSPGNNLERLMGSLKGYHSIRINDQYRIVFKWNNGCDEVRIVDYH
jgi:toxin HigB-1